MEKRPGAAFGIACFWLSVVAIVLAFAPVSVAYLSGTTGFSAHTWEAALSFVVPGLVALAALTLGIAGLLKKKQGGRFAALGIAISVIALAGCALTINGFEQVFGGS